MKTTKEQRDEWRNPLYQLPRWAVYLLDDADEAERLDKEVAELRAKLQQYKEALAMCTKQLGDIKADLIQK